MNKYDKTEALKIYSLKYDEYSSMLTSLETQNKLLNKKLKESPTPELYEQIENNLKNFYDLELKVNKLLKLTESLNDD